MKPDQWFTFWMTMVQTVGGGLVTLAGVYLGFRYSTKQSEDGSRAEAERADLEYWLEALTSGIDQLTALHEALFARTDPSDRRALYEPFVRRWSDRWFGRLPVEGTVARELILPVHQSVLRIDHDQDPRAYYPALRNLMVSSMTAVREAMTTGSVSATTEARRTACLRTVDGHLRTHVSSQEINV